MLGAVRRSAWIALSIVAAICAPVVFVSAGAATAFAAEPSVAEIVARLDALHARRDDPTALAEARGLAERAVAQAPGDYEVLWRAARVAFTDSDVPGRSTDDRSRLGKQGYDLAQRAIAANPNRVEGHYWAALGIGSYAEGMGVVRALANGIQ